jgi:hypothetical protein
MPNADQPRPSRRTVLALFYFAALGSALALGLAGRSQLFRKPLRVSATAGAIASIVFLVRFLHSNDEREQQINFQALTFAFVATLLFSTAIGFLQVFGFHAVSWLGIPALMVILWSVGLILYSWRYR